MRDGRENGSILMGETFGLKFLLKDQIKAKEFTWFDTGSLEQLEKARSHFHSDEFNILEKADEAIRFVDDKVIKFSIDTEFIQNRVKCTKFPRRLYSPLLNSSDNMYSYKKIIGETLSKKPNLHNFKSFLLWIENFWETKELSEEKLENFYKKNMSFYKDKTYKRVNNISTLLSTSIPKSW